MSETHALTRTSPKGGPFIGTCMKCGRTGLSLQQANEECENPSRMTQDEAVIAAVSPEMNNPVDQPKVSELDVKALEAAAKTLVYVSAANFHERGSGAAFLPNDDARAAAEGVVTAYLAALPQSQATTVGVKAVPLEPTGPMLDVGYRAMRDTSYKNPLDELRGVYHAMIAAAPLALIGIPGAEKGEAISDKMAEAALMFYRSKLAEYDADFNNDSRPDNFWREKYGTNLHATSLGEIWAMKQVLLAAPTSERVQALEEGRLKGIIEAGKVVGELHLHWADERDRAARDTQERAIAQALVQITADINYRLSAFIIDADKASNADLKATP